MLRSQRDQDVGAGHAESGGEPQYGARREEAADLSPAADLAAGERRLRRNTYLVAALAVIIGGSLAGWRMALGTALGGALSVFNERWLRGSVGAILSTAARSGNERVPRWTAAKFILRYLVIAIIAGAAVWSGYFDLLGVGIGLASFVGAVMVEAGYQFYLTFKTSDS
jgi:hypothetical protein